MLQHDNDKWHHDQYQQLIHSLPESARDDLQRAESRAFKPSSRYHLTFSLFTAGHAPSSWDVRQSVREYINPILHTISSTTNISVTSQVQLYSSFSSSIRPQQIEDGWLLQKQDLTSFINTAEWPLTPSIGQGPTMNFVVYIPDQGQIPLLIQDSPSNSWLVPQWGGIVVLNPPLVNVEGSELGRTTIGDHLDQNALKPAFEIFQRQLLQLLGVPYSTQMSMEQRLQIFQQMSALSLFSGTSSNLRSLARLSERLASIPIPRHVLHFVEDAIKRMDDFKQCFESRSSACFNTITEAFRESEEAFFDKSMVGQVYFPDEHKVAVYLPLLGPIGVPLVVSLLRELKSLKG